MKHTENLLLMQKTHISPNLRQTLSSLRSMQTSFLGLPALFHPHSIVQETFASLYSVIYPLFYVFETAIQ